MKVNAGGIRELESGSDMKLDLLSDKGCERAIK